MSDELDKGESGRKVEEEEKKYRGIPDKNSYFANNMSDFFHNCSVKHRLDQSGRNCL